MSEAQMSDALQHAITNRVARIRAGDDPQCLGRTSSGWAILAKFQPDPVSGGCMLLPDPVVPSLEDLPRERRAAFLCDLGLLGEAVRAATGAERINHLILCNRVPELHAHCVPRFASEDPSKRLLDPFEAYDFGAARVADALGADRELFERLGSELSRLGAIVREG